MPGNRQKTIIVVFGAAALAVAAFLATRKSNDGGAKKDQPDTKPHKTTTESTSRSFVGTNGDGMAANGSNKKDNTSRVSTGVTIKQSLNAVPNISTTEGASSGENLKTPSPSDQETAPNENINPVDVSAILKAKKKSNGGTRKKTNAAASAAIKELKNSASAGKKKKSKKANRQ